MKKHDAILHALRVNDSTFQEVPMLPIRMTRKTWRRPASLPILAMLAAALILPGAGCKKKPGPVTSTPEPPAQASAPAEPINEQPMKPIVDEPAPQRGLGAAEYNRQGLLKTVYFDYDKSEIRPDQRPTLQANADRLKTDPLSKFKVVIEGHCDERNTNEYNMALGDKRANAVKQYLIGLGVPAARLRTISYGEERPADPGHNEEAWARNRRCEFVLEEG